MLFSAATVLAADGAYVSQKGSWLRNKTESKIPAGSFTPIDEPMVVTKDDGTNLSFTIYMMSPDGLVPGTIFEGIYDGKPYTFGKDTLAFAHVSPTSYRIEIKSGDGASATELVTFSANNTRMRAEGKRTEKSGKTYDYVQIWDRIE